MSPGAFFKKQIHLLLSPTHFPLQKCPHISIPRTTVPKPRDLPVLVTKSPRFDPSSSKLRHVFPTKAAMYQMPWGINHYSKVSFSWRPFIKAYEQLRECYYSPWKIINKKSTTRWAPINQKMEWNGASFKIAEGGVLAPTSKEAHVCNGKNGLHWLLGVPLDCHEFILGKIQPEFGASFLYHLFWWYFDKIHADSVETFQGTKHQTPGNSGRWVKQSHRIILVRSWFIIAFYHVISQIRGRWLGLQFWVPDIIPRILNFSNRIHSWSTSSDWCSTPNQFLICSSFRKKKWRSSAHLLITKHQPS